jgi:hypothetical protein
MRALVTGIKPYLSRLSEKWTDHAGRRFDGFEPIRTKKQVLDASRFNSNTGNYFVGEGAIEAIGREKAHFVDFGVLLAKTKDQEYLANTNRYFDVVVFAAANMLRRDYDAGLEAELLSRLNLPAIVLGIGCQRTADLEKTLPGGTRRFIEVLGSKDHTVFTRGAATADYLMAQGLRNVWPTGCPSMFMRPDNVVVALRKLVLVDWTTGLRIAFSGYLGRNINEAKDFAVFANRQKDCTYVLQDEHLFYGLEFVAEDDEDIYNDASGELIRGCSFRGAAVVSDIRKCLFFNTHQWRAAMAMHEVGFGKRFHGVVAALQAGVPGLMIAVDDRMREMLNQSRLPYIDIIDWNAATDKKSLISRVVASFDVDRFCETYCAAVTLFRSRMASIGLG